MKTVLFQGDSITDAGRNRDRDEERGLGYPTLTAAHMGYEYPGVFTFINRGDSGDRVVDVYARIKEDIINLQPDFLTILIGVNDVWHELHEEPNGVDAAKYEKIYSMLIEEVKTMCPAVKIIILEPFVLRASATDSDWGVFSSEVKLRSEAAKNVADKFGLDFIPLQADFDKLCEKCEASYWLKDGVHPTSAGHELIARKVTAALEKAAGLKA